MNSGVIPTRTHGALDYLAGGLNLALPRLLGLRAAPLAALVPRLNGAAGVVYALVTDYELGFVKVLPMPTHLKLDAAKGVFMASLPWLFGFAKNGPRFWLPHVVMGTADVVVSVASKTGRGITGTRDRRGRGSPADTPHARGLPPRRPGECFARSTPQPERSRRGQEVWSVREEERRWPRITARASRTTNATRGCASKGKAARIANTGRSQAGKRGGESSSHEDWSKEDLQDRARELGIEGRSKRDKGDLIEAFRNH